MNVNMLSDILMTYCMYNFDLGKLLHPVLSSPFFQLIGERKVGGNGNRSRRCADRESGILCLRTLLNVA